jgi:hypothetical protein
MTTSPLQPTNDLVEQSPLTAFHAFLESERPVLTTALVRDLTEHAPHYRTMSDEQRVERVSENIDDYLAGLELGIITTRAQLIATPSLARFVVRVKDYSTVYSPSTTPSSPSALGAPAGCSCAL